MDNRAAHLISTLDLQPHPEGGHFREVFRSEHPVRPADERGERSALTTIYFLLRSGEHSRLHRVTSDEIWHFYEGDPLELFWLQKEPSRLHRARIGPVGSGTAPVAVVPAGCWQAARSTGEYTLVGCSVAPGFDFADFRMLDDGSTEASRLATRHPELQPFL